MEENRSIFDYISKVFTVFGVVVLIHIIIGLIVGEDATEMSTLFSLGSEGLAMSTLLQLFALSVVVIVLQTLFLTDMLIRNMSIVLRIILMFVSVTCAIVVFVFLCKWFPVDEGMAWAGFFISFAICSMAGVLFSRLREKAENRKMEAALKKYKE